MSERTASIEIESPSAADVTWFIADRDVSLFANPWAWQKSGVMPKHEPFSCLREKTTEHFGYTLMETASGQMIELGSVREATSVDFVVKEITDELRGLGLRLVEIPKRNKPRKQPSRLGKMPSEKFLVVSCWYVSMLLRSSSSASLETCLECGEDKKTLESDEGDNPGVVTTSPDEQVLPRATVTVTGQRKSTRKARRQDKSIKTATSTPPVIRGGGFGGEEAQGSGGNVRVGLNDDVPKPLMLQAGSVEPNGNRRDLLDLATQQQEYVSQHTSPFHCACALHGAFGNSISGGAHFLPEAREFGSQLIEKIISSEEPAHRTMRSNLADLIQEELATPVLEGRADTFAEMFWSTADLALKTRIQEHWHHVRRAHKEADAVKENINQRARTACASDDSGLLEVLTTHLIPLDSYWQHFYEDPFDWVGGGRVVRGTRAAWPEDARYDTKLAAMRDPREVFDPLRKAYFLPNQNDAKKVVDCIYVLADGRSDGEGFREIADMILSIYLEKDALNTSWPRELQDSTLHAYVKTIRNTSYYFSVGELVWM